MKEKLVNQGRTKRILIDKTATWATLLPSRRHEYYTERIQELDSIEGNNLVLLDLVVDAVRREIIEVCERQRELSESYEEDVSVDDRSPCGFYHFVKRLRDQTPLGDELNLLKHLQAHIVVLARTWVREKLSERNQYVDLKEAFIILSINSEQKYHGSPREILPFPNPCVNGVAPKSGCPAKKLLRFLFKNWGEELDEQIKRHLTRIQQVARLMITRGGEYLGVSVVPPVSPTLEQIISVAHFFAQFARSLYPTRGPDPRLAAFNAWASELWEQATSQLLVTNIRREMRKQCLHHCVTAIPFALGTMWAWNQNKSEEFEAPDGLFTFDRRLAFCPALKMHDPLDYQGVDCRCEFRYPWDKEDLTITVEVEGKRQDLTVIDESMRRGGFSAKSNGFYPSPYEILSTSWSYGSLVNSSSCDYLVLAPDPPKRLRFRYLFDIDPDPMLLITSEV